MQTRIAQFQDDINNILKSSGGWDKNGKSYGWREAVVERYYSEFERDIADFSYNEKRMLFDKDILEKLSNDIELLS